MRRLRCLWVLLLGLASARAAEAEMLVPGTYHGIVREDRWGQMVLQQGPYALFLSAPVYELLRGEAGIPLALEVTDIRQPINPGGGRVDGVGAVRHEPVDLEISLERLAADEPIPADGGPTLIVTLKNLSDSPLHRPLEALWVVFTHRGGNVDDTPGASGEKLLLYHASLWEVSGASKQRLFMTAVEVPFATSSLDPRYSEDIAPGSVLEMEVTLAVELSPGEYEVFLYRKTGNFSSLPGAMSNVLAFDVVEHPR